MFVLTVVMMLAWSQGCPPLFWRVDASKTPIPEGTPAAEVTTVRAAALKLATERGYSPQQMREVLGAKDGYYVISYEVIPPRPELIVIGGGIVIVLRPNGEIVCAMDQM